MAKAELPESQSPEGANSTPLTGNPHRLATAKLNAAYWMEHTSGGDPVPPNDFDKPRPPRRWESSAAACAAGGLIMLAALDGDNDTAVR
jgi:hypothetical protein